MKTSAKISRLLKKIATTSNSRRGPRRNRTATARVDELEPRCLLTTTIDLVSIADPSFGSQPGTGASSNPRISADGQFVAFDSSANDLVVGDNRTFAPGDVFVRNMTTGAIMRVSTDSSGQEANHSSFSQSISGNGRFVAFMSNASNLVPGDTNSAQDVFVKDTQTGITTRVSTNSSGNQANGSSGSPSISADGRYVAFQSFATNLVTGDLNGKLDIFLKDTVTGVISRISTDSSNVQSDDHSFNPEISGNGLVVVFQSGATNLVSNDTNAQTDVFAKNMVTGVTSRISVNSSGVQGNGFSGDARLSADGRFVSFISNATNFVGTDRNLTNGDVFLKDRESGALTLVNANTAGLQTVASANNGNVSDNGRFVVFSTTSNELAPNDTNAVVKVFVKDILTQAVQRISQTEAGVVGNGDSAAARISGSGAWVVFQSVATNLNPLDGTNTQDIYRAEFDLPDSPPADISISSNSVAENSGVGTVVGIISAAESTPSATSFALVPGALDNSKFTLTGNDLKTAEVFNYEAVSHYVVRVTATSAGVTITRDLSIFVGAVNEFNPQLTSPLGLSVAENTLTAATFSATDLDSPTPSFTYSIVGGADAARFTVSGNRLSFAASPNFEAPADADANNQYVVQVAVSDGSRSQTNTLTISVTNVNEAPANIALSNLTFAESLPAGSVVGTLSATDADGPLPITFAFASSANDNVDFEIVGNQLRTRREFDYETLADRDLSIQLVARDGLNAASVLRTLNLSVTDASERPVANDLTLSTNRNVALPLTLGGDVVNPTFTITQHPSKGTLTGIAPNLIYTPNTNAVGNDEFFYTISRGGQTSYEARVSISVLSVLPTATFEFAQIGLIEAYPNGILPARVNLNAPVLTDTIIKLALAAGGTATVDQDFSIPSSVLVRAGESTGIALVNIINDEIDEANEFFTVRIDAAPDYLVGSQSTYQVIIADDDAPPDISLEKTSLTLDEANTSTTVRLRLSAIATQDILVPWTLTTQGATIGSDFTLAGGSVFSGGGNYLRIPAGANTAFLTIHLTDDTAIENPESLKIQFNAPAYGTLKTPADSAYTLTIRDNDERIISLQRSLVTVGEAAGTYTLTAVASPPFTEATTVPVWFGGSAVSTSVGRDYSVGSPGAFVFGANQSTASLSLTIVDDSTAEREEGIMVALLDDSTSYKLGSIAQTFITITDNDTSLLSFSTASSDPWENAGNQTVSVSLTKALSEPITIPLVLTTGTGFATKNTDFRFNTTSLTIPAGQTSASATLEILNDGANEGNETIRIAFGTLPANALVSVGTNSSTTIVIRDDDPLLSIRAVSSSVPENGTAEFDLLLSAPTWNGVTAIVFLGGTAVLNTDYTRQRSDSFINYLGMPEHLNYPFLAVIPPSITSLRLRLPIVNDSQAENTETITAAFTVSSGALQAPANAATVSINDDDQNAVAFSTASGNISEAATTTRLGLRRIYKNRQHTVSVAMAQAATRDINVGIAFGGTAEFGVDYKVLDLDAKSGLIIRKGNKSASFLLEIIRDSVFEGDETIKAAIVAVTAPGTLVNPASTREFKILDDDKPSGGSTFALWGGEEDLEAIAAMRAAIVKSNQALVLAGTLAITTSPSVGLIPFETTTAAKLSGTAVFDINGNTSILPGTIALATGSKGPVEGALAFFDANFNGVLDYVDSNGNGVQDDDELSEFPATTAADGSFAFELDGFDTDNNGVDASEGRLVLSGGTDLSTGLVGLIPLTAPIGLFNITPLSTIAESLVRLNQWTVSEAVQRTTQAFGISNYNLAEGVSLYQVLGNDGLAAQAYSTHVQIYSVAVGLAEFLAGVSGRDVALLGSLIFDEIARFISTEGSTIDLTSPEVISAIAQSVIEKQAIDPITVENSNAVSSAIVNGILELQKVQLASDGADAGEAFLSSIYKAKKVVQGILPADLHLLGSGNQTAAFINGKYTTTGIAGLVAMQTATVIVPPVVGIDSLAIVEGDNGLQNLVFTATLIGKHSYPVSVDYATADATATATADALGDYRAQSGTLTWAANNNDLKYISIPIEGDTAFEADEFFRILLGNPTGLVIRQAEGRGFISNNDLLTLTTSAPESQAANELLVSLSSGKAQINENGQEILDGPFLMPVQAEFSGQPNFPDQWTVDFSKNHFRADTWTFDGKVGPSDELTVAAGSFTEIEYSILTSSNSSIKLRDESLVGQISLNAVNMESSRLHVSEINDLIVRIPGSIASLVIEDVHISETGRMRIRSTDGSFAPIEFTNPTGSIRLVLDSASTLVAELSRDPGFSGTIDVTFSDVTKPISSVSPLPSQSTLSFVVTATGTDPNGSEGSASGLKEYDLYVSSGGAFTKFATVPAGSPTTTFTGSANTTYWFRSLGRDNAGNVESKTTSDTFTRIGDVVPPSTNVTSAVPTSNGLFTIQMTGTKIGGTPLTAFDVYVSIDGNTPLLAGTTSSLALGGGNYSGQIQFQGPLDSTSHTYRFFSRGRDSAGNVEPAPVSGDVSVTYSFAAAALTATAIDVQNGVNQRSYVRYLDVLFSSSTGLSNLLSTDHVKVERYGIDATVLAPGMGTPVTGFTLSQQGNRLRLDFGANGLGGLRQAGNGFYRVYLDLDLTAAFNDIPDRSFEFHRLFGDATGDGKVDVADTNLVTSQIGRTGVNLDGDLDGNGSVNSTDRLFTTQQRGRKLLDDMLGFLDD